MLHALPLGKTSYKKREPQNNIVLLLWRYANGEPVDMLPFFTSEAWSMVSPEAGFQMR